MGRTRAADLAPLRIEPENEWAWCGERRLDLTPRVFAVLRHLASHPGRLVTKHDLLDKVWGETVVSEAALASCIRDLRRALGDSSRAPRYVETVHRRGFRFIGPLASPPDSGARRSRPAAEEAERTAPPLVGRERELARLHGLLATALAGRRRVVLVTGEAGIGKTTLVEAFLAQVEGGADGARIARGQCVEHYGAGEAYLPVLEALGRMGRDRGGDALVRTLRQYAPTWLVQLPALLADDDLEAVQRRALGSTRERMLRELIEALDALCADAPLILLLEDLHWSDSGTVDLLAMLSRRRDAARLLVVATYRPADVIAGAHPLRPVKQELRLHGYCEEMALDFLDEEAVGVYLAGRLPGASLPRRLVRVLHRNTSGNPLLLVSVIDHLVARGHLRDAEGRWRLTVPPDEIASDVPQTLAEIVDKQLERLTPLERQVIAVASVAGNEFPASLASVDGIDVAEAEGCCAGLARRGQFLRDLGVAEWPDGTIAGRYGFVHALYRSALYARVDAARRVGLHARIGARLEAAHGSRSEEIAGELAMHFEHGRDFPRALRYRQQAADNALRHQGPREAASHAERALELLAAFPESPERVRRELAIRTVLGAALIPQGSTAPDVVRTYARTYELCRAVGATPELFPTLVGLFRYYVSRMDLAIASDLASDLSTLARTTEDPAIVLGAHNASGLVAFYAGDFAAALGHLQAGLAVYDPQQHSARRWPAFWGGHDAGVSCGVHAGWTLWVLGEPARAVTTMREALDRARSCAYPFTLANACGFAAALHACRGDADAVRDAADEALLQSTEHGFELLRRLDDVYRGWLLGHAGEREEGAARLRQGVAAYAEGGGHMGLATFLALEAELEGLCGRADQGLAVVARALALSAETGAHYWDAELRRIEGDLLLAAASRRRGERRDGAAVEGDAEARFQSALEIARRQGARGLELRAATSLARLWLEQGRGSEARRLLSGPYASFAAGLETPDPRRARDALEASEISAREPRAGRRAHRTRGSTPASRRRTP